MDNLIHKELSYKVVGLLYKVHGELGRFCKERQYGDLFENFLVENKLNYKREFPMEVAERKSSFADFIIEDSIILEFKVKPFIEKEDYFQTKRYLELTNKRLGIIVNFRNKYLLPKRVLNNKMPH